MNEEVIEIGCDDEGYVVLQKNLGDGTTLRIGFTPKKAKDLAGALIEAALKIERQVN